MDRNKKGKSSKPHFLGSGELIALGKNTRPGATGSAAAEASTAERKGSFSGSSSSGSKSTGSSSKPFSGGSSSSGSKSTSSTSSTTEQKREATSASPHEHPVAKKSRIHGSTSSASGSGSSSKPSSGSSSSSSLKVGKPVKRDSIDSVNVKPEELEKDAFFAELEKADKHSNTERGQSLVVAAIKKLRANREKPDLRLCEMVMMASKVYPHFCTGSSVVNALSSLATFKKTNVPDIKLKFSQHNLAIFAPIAVNILANAFSKSSSWPTVFAQLWVEDACGDRFWVDTAHSKSVVDNIVHSFGTEAPNPSLLPPSDGGPGSLPSGASSPSLALGDDSNIQIEANQIIIDQRTELSLQQRFNGKETTVETIITDWATELLTKRAPDIPRNLIKALGQASGLSGVRAFIATKLEQWLHNPKCGRQSQELLLTVCVNAHCNTNADIEIVSQISKLRMKTKPLMLFHSIAVREMVRDNDVSLRYVLNQIIYNELSPQRHPNNLPILGSIIAGIPESRSVLASIFLELLTKREDFHAALRLLLREILRNCRFECDLLKFLKGLLKKSDREVVWLPEFRERGFLAIADLIMLSMFLSVSPQVREASMVRGDSKDQSTLQTFRKQIASMQNEAVLWLYSEVPTTFAPSKTAFMIALNKIILKDAAADLITKDGWPPEAEKALFSRLILDVPVSENIVIWLSLMGLHKDFPVLPREVFDLIELLIVRAATHRSVLKFGKRELYELFFRLGEYKHPDEIALPEGYEPPKLAISKLYWQAWLILCILAAHNPLGFGSLGWEEYPTLKMLMEMCMTNRFQFPTASTTAGIEDIMSKEVQTVANKKQEILEFETHLAAASSKQTINERNSLLLSQLMRLDPFGTPRNPPSQFLAQLQHLNVELSLGHLLCRSRNPDFLLDLIQNNSQPMPWLSQLVSEGSFDMLPVQCLCEFFLGNSHKLLKGVKGEGIKAEEGSSVEKSPRKHGKTAAPAVTEEHVKDKDGKTLQLLHHLNEVINSSEELADAREVIEYFLRRLSSPKVQSRQQSVQGLQFLFASPPFTHPVDNWLMDCLPNLHIFADIKDQVVLLLRQALQMETEPILIYKYIEFINVWGGMSDTDGGASLVMDIASLVVERNILMSVLLGTDTTGFEPFFDIFLGYMKFVRQPQKNEYRWSENEDMLLVRWASEKLEAIINHQIIQATVVLIITYSQVCSKTGKDPMVKTPLDMKFNDLMDIWFPHSKENAPKGFLLNTTEEALLFPAWLTLRMARSDNGRLLQAALRDLDTENLLAFFQSFGFPPKSMSALLYCLDASVEQNPDNVKVHIKNPTYLKSLTEIHWKKGIQGGNVFYRLVERMANEQAGVIKSVKGATSSKKGSHQSTSLRPVLSIPSIKEPSSRSQIKLKDNKQGGRQKSASALRKEQISSSDKSATSSYESEVCDEETSRMKIANLSKQLFSLSSPPNSRRRSSVPVDPYGGLDDPMGAAMRRHSSYGDAASLAVKSKGMEEDGVAAANNLGELVDNITYIEPCIVRHAMDYQLPLLFGRSEIHPNCRSFLMTVLTHQAGWETVENLITLFLKEFDSSHDPAAVLDLISATSSNPKLWQGVDKYVPRHQPNISPFHLTEDQLVTMAEYIVEEISQVEMRSTKFSITNLLGPSQPSLGKSSKTVKNGLQERVKLWLQCCQQDKDVVDHVISNLMDKKGKNPCAKKMVAQVYLEFPEVMFVDKWVAKAEELNFTEEEITCVLDNVSHTLITGIANIQPGKDWAKKASHEIEICLRKLASVHPTLLLRQLPLMGTLLEGRAHLEYSAFHQQNHHIPFVVFLGLLDLMQPHVLKHFQVLKGAFSLYFKLFQDYGHLKDYSSSLSRFSVLLHNFLSANPKEVKEYLSPYYNTLRELSMVKYYTDVYPLQNLLSFLVPPNMVSDLCAATPAQVKNLGTDANTASFVSSMTDRFLHVSNNDELVPILQELDMFSSRSPAVLYHFSEHLSPLLNSESDCCRNQALSLIIKHVTYSPGSCSNYLESMMQALESRNSHVRDSVLERIHEFIVLCQENGEEILMKIFELGVHSNINVGAALKKSLSLLRNYSSTNQF